MRDSYEPPRKPAWIGAAVRASRTGGLGRRSKLAWRAAQLSALGTVGFVALFVHNAAAQTTGTQTREHSPATAARAAQPTSAAPAAAPVPTLAPPSAAPTQTPGAVQTTSSGSSGSAGDDDGHGGKDGDGGTDD